MHTQAKGFCQVKKNPRKTRKWVGVSSPNSDFFFWGGGGNFGVFCVVFMFPNVFKTEQKLDRGWVDGVGPIRVFLGFLYFFKLARPLNSAGRNS